MPEEPAEVDVSAIEDTDNTPKPEDGVQDDLDQSKDSAYDEHGDPALPLPPGAR